jgi:antiviral helicase SKI2
MILGKATKLESQFRVTYSMILNLLRVQTLKVEEMIKRSFSENSAQKGLPEQKKALEEKSKLYTAMTKLSCTICESDIYEFYDACSRIIKLGFDLKERIITSVLAPKILAPGRIVILNNSVRSFVFLFYHNLVDFKT